MKVAGSKIYWRSKDGGRGFWNILEAQGWRLRILEYIVGPRMKVVGSKGRGFWNIVEVQGWR